MEGSDASVLDPPQERAEVVRVLLQQLDPDLPEPGYARAGDAGADLRARHDAELPPGGRATVATGVAIALPEGYAAFVHPRSGLAARHGVTTLNGPGTVDAGYRGEVLVTLVNTDRDRSFSVRRGDRVAQLVVQRVARAAFELVERLPSSERGRGGHGSTGGWGTAAPAVPHRAGSATVDADEAVLGTATGTGGARAAADRRTTETSGRAGAPGKEQS
ncbi:dUTP diphosphatase [Pseudokineococcus basanitobsidens]|uniref:Deoxyuridine 5'-triphosphate nucleotidohydrolase n=1 Tax=Pseudokineococcus basanitobsidens TaxID=1926649 RepID=A0ABU8RHF8_9ACTN